MSRFRDSLPNGLADRLLSNPPKISRRHLLRGAAALTTLSLLGGSTTSIARADDAEYTVQPGNTLYGIASKFGLSVGDLAAANDLANPNRLAIGQKLRIPGQAAPEAPAAQPAPAPEPEPDRSTSSRGGSSGGSTVVDLATKNVGRPYAWAGTSPERGFDCSGLVYYVYNLAGMPVGRNLPEQLAAGARVPFESLQPGDLVFFANTYAYGLSHVGIYVGDGQFIHAEDEANGVRVSSLSGGYWRAHFYAANRPGARP